MCRIPNFRYNVSDELTWSRPAGTVRCSEVVVVKWVVRTAPVPLPSRTAQHSTAQHRCDWAAAACPRRRQAGPPENGSWGAWRGDRCAVLVPASAIFIRLTVPARAREIYHPSIPPGNPIPSHPIPVPPPRMSHRAMNEWDGNKQKGTREVS